MARVRRPVSFTVPEHQCREVVEKPSVPAGIAVVHRPLATHRLPGYNWQLRRRWADWNPRVVCGEDTSVSSPAAPHRFHTAPMPSTTTFGSIVDYRPADWKEVTERRFK